MNQGLIIPSVLIRGADNPRAENMNGCRRITYSPYAVAMAVKLRKVSYILTYGSEE
jgi:hypothetical protein